MNIKTIVIRDSRAQLVLSLIMKFIGMILLFTTVKVITSKSDLPVYGQYNQAISLLLFFCSISTLGYGQSFIRDNADLTNEEKIGLYIKKKNVVRLASLLAAPFIFAIAFFILGANLYSSFLLTTSYILLSTGRLRFTY